MNTLIIFYSFSGKTKAIATEMAIKEAADVTEIKGEKRPGKLKAYTVGIYAAIKGKAWPIQPLETEISKYDRLILLAPIWADNPAPPLNALLELLPEGKAVALKMVSASGKSNCKERLETTIKQKGCIMESFEDIKA